mgnify:CR=1 FL=1
MILLANAQHHAVNEWRDVFILNELLSRWCISRDVAHPKNAADYLTFDLLRSINSVIASERGCVVYQIDQAKLPKKTTDSSVLSQPRAGKHSVNKTIVIDGYRVAHHSKIITICIHPFGDLFIIFRSGAFAGLAILHCIFRMVGRGNA